METEAHRGKKEKGRNKNEERRKKEGSRQKKEANALKKTTYRYIGRFSVRLSKWPPRSFARGAIFRWGVGPRSPEESPFFGSATQRPIRF